MCCDIFFQLKLKIGSIIFVYTVEIYLVAFEHIVLIRENKIKEQGVDNMSNIKKSNAKVSVIKDVFSQARALSFYFVLVIVLSVSLSSFKINAQEDFSSAYKLYNQAIESNNNADAIKYAKVALKMGSEEFGDQDANTANLKYNLALAYIDDKQILPAFELLDEIKQDYLRLFGEGSDEHFAAVLDQLDTSKLDNDYSTKERIRLFKPLVSYAEGLVEKIAEAQPERGAFVYYDLARVLNVAPLNGDFFDEGLEINRKAERFLLAKFGQNDLRTIEVRFMLARFLQSKEKRNDAIEYYEKIITTVTSAIDTSHPFELASHAALVQLYESKGKSEEATEHCLAIGRMKPWSDDIEPSPLYRLNPKYPEKLARKEKEGYVELEFIISSFGFVQDIKVLKSSDEGFEQSSVDAVAKWRYAPKILEGKAIASQKLKVRLDYTLG